MPQLTWNDTGKRFFEVGVDRGVLYTSDGTGVVWNGLTAVTESPSGGDATPYYIDGVKYLNIAAKKEFEGTLQAYTYPEEFMEYDGWEDLGNGLSLDEQSRKSFGLSYRTGLGNDLDGKDHGYKIHILYNALSQPTQSAYTTIGDEADPLDFSWGITTTPIRVPGHTPLSHIVIDSTKTHPTQLKFIEDFLYGTEGETVITDSYMYILPGQVATLPTLEQIIDWFARPMLTLDIDFHPTSGLSPLIISEDSHGDLRGRLSEGIYTIPPGSRLTELVNFEGYDGGNATSTFTGPSLDGGDAFSSYSGIDNIDGGNASTIFTGTGHTGFYTLNGGSA